MRVQNEEKKYKPWILHNYVDSGSIIDDECVNTSHLTVRSCRIANEQYTILVHYTKVF